MSATDTTFEQMYREYHGTVHGAALRILGDPARAQDVAHDVFERMWRRPDRFDPSRGELGPYLRLMARSRALDVYREGQAAGRASDRLKVVVAQQEGREDERPEPALARAEDSDEISAALASLPDAQRDAILLAYWGGLTADEIARRSEVPLGTAKSRLRLGLTKLRTELEPAVAA